VCSSDLPSQVKRFLWFWKWTLAAVNYFAARNRNVSTDALVHKLKSVVQGVVLDENGTTVSADQPESSSFEDTFFDKTVQTLVHEHLPMGVIMIQFGPNGFSEDEPPVLNNMVCELFGYGRQDFTNLLTDVHGWHRVYHRAIYLDSFKGFIKALAAGTESYVANASYVHKSGWMFEGLESRKISYSRDGLPLYATIYIQRCDGPVMAKDGAA